MEWKIGAGRERESLTKAKVCMHNRGVYSPRSAGRNGGWGSVLFPFPEFLVLL